MTDPFSEQLDQLIRARCPILYVLTYEEKRAREILASIAGRLHKALLEWSITDGLRAIDSRPMGAATQERIREPMTMLNEVLQKDVSAIYVLKDFHAYMEAPEIVRQMRDLDIALRRSRKTIVILSPILKIPPELEKSISILDLPLPTFDDLRELLLGIVKTHRAARQYEVKLTEEDGNNLVRAAQGLTLQEAENAFARAIIEDQLLDGADISAVIAEKKQVIRKSGILEYYDPTETISDVGGMDLLKGWIRKRGSAFSEEARAYGLPQPKGLLMMGVQGCGKSLFAKSVAALWRLPLLRMDMGRIFEGYIGSSEQNMRRAVNMAEGLAPIVMWIDEIEKAFSGVEGSSSTDAGTTARVVGTFLTWMQEKTSPVFVVATANDVKGLPPELLRKGRFDEIFFIDLPHGRERADIFTIHLGKLSRDPADFDLKQLVTASHGFSGAEIEQAIISALHDSFFENREVTTDDIAKSIEETVPLSRTMAEKIEDLRNWARDRARPVSSLQRPSAPRLES